jgi:[ribosomal protein S5]-alanine N-acetyltransferase
MSEFKHFETQRLLLRPTQIDDAAFQLELMNSELWIKNIGDRGVYTIQAAEQYIETKIRAQFKRLGYANYTVVRKIDNALMGAIGLYDRPGMEGIDIGFAFLPAYFGQGYAYEGAARLLDAAIHEFKLTKIKAITIPSNIASQKLLEKLGLKFIKNIKLNDGPEELMYYEIDGKGV